MMKRINVFVLVLITLLMTGCRNEENKWVKTTPTPTIETNLNRQDTPVPTGSDSVTISGGDSVVSPEGNTGNEVTGGLRATVTPTPIYTDAPVISGGTTGGAVPTVSGGVTGNGSTDISGSGSVSITSGVSQSATITATVTKKPVATKTPFVTKTPVATKTPVTTKTPVPTKTSAAVKTPTPTKTTGIGQKTTPTATPTPSPYEHAYSSQLHKAGQGYLTQNKSIANEHLEYVNQLRKSLGLNELTYDAACNNIAAYRTAEMASLGFFSHFHPPYDSLSAAPFEYSCMSDIVYFYQNDYRFLAENIAEFKISGATVDDWVMLGNSIAKQLYDQFYNSEGHYKNMVNPNYTKIGLCVYVSDNHVIITQIFE